MLLIRFSVHLTNAGLAILAITECATASLDRMRVSELAWVCDVPIRR